MAFFTGTITDANPGVAIYNIIEAQAIAQGWTLVDTVVIGGNTHKVLKSAAAGNAQNLDWYLDINYPTTGITGGIRFAPFENYNATTHVGVNGPYGGNTNTFTADGTTYSRFGTTGSALETNWANGATYTAMSNPVVVSAFTYYISLTRNRIYGILTNNATRLFYSGFFIPSSEHVATSGTALFPLIMAVLDNTGAASAGGTAGAVSMSASRYPKHTTMSVNYAGAITTFPLWNLMNGTIGIAASRSTNLTTIVQSPVVFGSNTNNNSSSMDTSFVGIMEGIAVGHVVNTAVRGDTVTVGSDLWYMITPNNTGTVLMRAV